MEFFFRHTVRSWLAAASYAAVLSAFPAAGTTGDGIVWPDRWKVFLPVDPEAPALPGDMLERIPEHIESGSRTLTGQWVTPEDVMEIDGRPVGLERVFLDLMPLFGEVRAENTAYVFLPLVSDAARMVTLGMGADWWMQAWVNGEKLIDTTETGNVSWPPMIGDQTAQASLREGLNVLAIRFVSGSGGSTLAVGGPSHLDRLARVQARQVETEIPWPGEDQAYDSARRMLRLDGPDADLSAGRIAGVRRMPDRQWVYDGPPRGRQPVLRDRLHPRFPEPVEVLLSRSRYPAEDRHLDAVVWLSPEGNETPGGHIEVVIRDAEGKEVARDQVTGEFPSGVFFSMGFPKTLYGTGARLEVEWIDEGDVRGRAERRFEVLPEQDVPVSGRVEIVIPNETGAVLRGAPVTVGVPFPRGALADETNARLIDEAGGETGLQTRVTARWSRFGPVKWLLCDFTVDLDGGPRKMFLEYGPEVIRRADAPIAVEAGDGGFPSIEAGRLRVSPEGVAYDAAGDGTYRRFLDGEALRGAFVRRGDGTTFLVPRDAAPVIEEAGSQKVVVRRTGWYEDPGSDERFCNYITRLVFHRDSPLVRIFHTWVFTGDGNREQIENMGWAFHLPEDFEGGGFLGSWADPEGWLQGSSLLQYDYEHFDVAVGDGKRDYPGGRAPGVAFAGGEGARLYLGVRDFWQGYPSEIEFRDGVLWFHNWPRRNRPAGYTFEGEMRMDSPGPALPSAARHAQVEPGGLTRSEWKLNLLQARFAHEGEQLSFRLPDAVTEDPIWGRTRLGRAGSTYWLEGQPETANAQGISRTEEIWLLLSAGEDDSAAETSVLRGLNEETLRAVVDPVWVAASGAFYEMHHRDRAGYPEEERVFDRVARAPGHWIERNGYYGMWIYGDIAAWRLTLERRMPALYRAFRKAHQGWPYSWIPFARSGDPALLRLADAATRRYIDVSFCHYYTEEISAQAGANRFRRRGRWHRSTLPWASRIGPTTRCYESQTDFLWHAYYLTGYARARDLALDWGALTQQGEDLPNRGDVAITAGANRATIALLKSYLDMYEATFDPWFLVSAHAVAEGHLRSFQAMRDAMEARDADATGLPPYGGSRGLPAGHFWRTADRDYLRFTGCDEYREYYLAYADAWGGHVGSPSWARYGAPMIESNAYAWLLTGEPYYLRRVAHYIDYLRWAVFNPDTPEYMQGLMPSEALSTGWYLQLFPAALWAIEKSGARPDPVYNSFFLEAERVNGEGAGGVRYETPPVFVRKEHGQALPLSFTALELPTRAPADETYAYRVSGPDGKPVLSGTWRVRERCAISIPADAPAGTYALRVGGETRRGLEMPVTPVGTPEVVAWDPDRAPGPRTAGRSRHTQVWFRVPEGVGQFRIEIPSTGRGRRRVSIWTPDGKKAWDRQATLDGWMETVTAEVEVAPGQAGRLWRITMPDGGELRLDPRLPPVLAVNPDRWFDPRE